MAETLRAEAMDWSGLFLWAAGSGTLRLLLLGIGLADGLLGAPLPEEARDRVSRDKAVSHLKDHVVRLLRGGEVPAWSELLFQARTRERWRNRMGFLLGSLVTPTLHDLRGVGSGGSAFRRRWARPLRLVRKYWGRRRGPGGWTRG